MVSPFCPKHGRNLRRAISFPFKLSNFFRLLELLMLNMASHLFGLTFIPHGVITNPNNFPPPTQKKHFSRFNLMLWRRTLSNTTMFKVVICNLRLDDHVIYINFNYAAYKVGKHFVHQSLIGQLEGHKLLAQVSLKQRIDKAKYMKVIGVWWRLMKIHLKIKF